MIYLIAGTTHTGKTKLAQRLLEEYHYPYLSVDHLKMGLIRSGQTTLTPMDDEELTEYLWPIVREMVKTVIENGQNMIVEGCYIPFDWKKDFEEAYLEQIRYCCCDHILPDKNYEISLPFERENAFLDKPWLKWAIEIQSIAQCGLTYTKDVYDAERYEQLRDISAAMLSHKSGISEEKVRTLFCNETGYQTPKLDSRAAIFQDGKILLVQEKNGTWSLPGGWVDVLESAGSNTVKEVWEEAGLRVEPERLIAVQDRNRHNRPVYAYGVCKIFLLCRVLGGEFRENSETIGTAYFDLEHLPELAEEKCTAEQIRMCFEACEDENWKVKFD